MLAITMFHGLAVGWADLVLPATSSLERDGTYVNLEGRLQRAAPRRHPAGSGRARLDLEARRALRRRAPAARRRSSSTSSPSVAFGGRRVRRGRRAGRAAAPRQACRRPSRSSEPQPPEPPASGHFLRLAPLPAALLRAGGRARPRAPVPAPAARGRALARRTRAAAGSRPATGRRPLERHVGRRSGRAVNRRAHRDGVVRHRRGARRRAARARVEVTKP